MMRPRLMAPVRGRDVAAGLLLWVGLVLAATGRATMDHGGAGAVLLLCAGVAVVILAVSGVMPYARPWPLPQWRAWRRRRGLAGGAARPLGMLLPGVYRSAIGLLIGEWLGARAADRVASAVSPQATVGGLSILLIIAVTVLLEG